MRWAMGPVGGAGEGRGGEGMRGDGARSGLGDAAGGATVLLRPGATLHTGAHARPKFARSLSWTLERCEHAVPVRINLLSAHDWPSELHPALLSCCIACSDVGGHLPYGMQRHAASLCGIHAHRSATHADNMSALRREFVAAAAGCR